jgi:Fe-S-cluster-containing dehydrogenase component/DMSO reductase anchor subunit
VSDSTLIEELLREQQTLSAVERFSRFHDRLDSRAKLYSHLLPAEPPSPDQQYAFSVQLDLCTGCKACVTACHSLNGLDSTEAWRDTGLLTVSTPGEPFQQTVTSACHHCLDPACLNGCPVQAYEKHPVTGAVQHLDDQCIGCQYCVLKCPYDVPKYSESRGIVRKCDLCSQRLTVGEAPACVQACPAGAITITLVDRTPTLTDPTAQMLPGAFPSAYTQPTTRYLSQRPLPPDAQPATSGALQLEPPHFPLVGMLALTQLAAGSSLVFALLFPLLPLSAAKALSAFTAAALHLGLISSVFHLGKPWGAWRFFLGLRTSWMSREILAFGIYSLLTLLTAASLWIPADGGIVPFLGGLPTGALHALAFCTAAFGLLSVGTSAMIYIDTRRPAWPVALTLIRFLGSVLILGPLAVATLLSLLPAPGEPGFRIWIHTVSLFAAALQAVVCWVENREHTRAFHTPSSPRHSTALLVRKFHPGAMKVRTFTAFACAFLTLTAPALPISLLPLLLFLAFLLTLGHQLFERMLFFTTAHRPRMPGIP